MKSRRSKPKVQQSQGSEVPMPNNFNQINIFESQSATITGNKHANAKQL
jgi:hypothetical protein